MRSVFRSYCNNKNWKLAFQILDKMILPLGMRIKKYSRETGSFTPPYSRWGWEQKYDLFQEFECPTDMSSPTSLATFQGQVLKLREQEGAFEGTWGGGPSAASSVLLAPAMLVHGVSKGFRLAKELARGNFPSESPPSTSPSLLTYLSPFLLLVCF